MIFPGIKVYDSGYIGHFEHKIIAYYEHPLTSYSSPSPCRSYGASYSNDISFLQSFRSYGAPLFPLYLFTQFEH